MSDEFVPYSAKSGRKVRVPERDEPNLGPLQHLPGTWANIRPTEREDGPFVGKGTLDGKGKSPFDGRGWNLIALPFAEAGQRRNYRLLMNQYNEVLSFKFIDDGVPNRGITASRPAENADQIISAIDYEQMIAQIKAVDVSISDLAGDPKLAIHHEPGFFLHVQEP